MERWCGVSLPPHEPERRTPMRRVDAMGHEWPDSPPFNANVQIIDFRLTHSR